MQRVLRQRELRGNNQEIRKEITVEIAFNIQIAYENQARYKN